MYYKIKKEFFEMWGDCDEETVITTEEIEELACGWGVTVEQLMGEVNPVDIGADKE